MVDGISIRATGMSAKFQSKVGQMSAHVETEGGKAVQAQMTSVRQVVVNTTPVDTGYLKAHWGPLTARGPLAYGFGTDVDYAATLEYGGYRKVGPRTVRLGGADLGAGFVAGAGIYSRQAPLGFVRKALAQSVEQFRKRIRTVLRIGWGGLGQTDVADTESPPPPPRNWGQRQIAISPTGHVDPEVLHAILESLAGG